MDYDAVGLLRQGRPAAAETVEVVRTLEAVLARAPTHPGAHPLLHPRRRGLDDPEHAPRRGRSPAARWCPAPATWCTCPRTSTCGSGRYDDAVESQRARRRGRRVVLRAMPRAGLLPGDVLPAQSALPVGGGELPMVGARSRSRPRQKIVDLVPTEKLREFPFLEEMLPMHLFTQARFGRWDEILATPPPPPVPATLRHVALRARPRADRDGPHRRSGGRSRHAPPDRGERRDAGAHAGVGADQRPTSCSGIATRVLDGRGRRGARPLASGDPRPTRRRSTAGRAPLLRASAVVLPDARRTRSRAARAPARRARPKPSIAASCGARRRAAGRSTASPRACARRARTRKPPPWSASSRPHGRVPTSRSRHRCGESALRHPPDHRPSGGRICLTAQTLFDQLCGRRRLAHVYHRTFSLPSPSHVPCPLLRAQRGARRGRGRTLVAKPAAAQVCGDATGDGIVTVTDGVQTLRAAAQLATTCTTATCDVDGSGTITVTDGVNVLRKAAGLVGPRSVWRRWRWRRGRGRNRQRRCRPLLVFGFTGISDVSLPGAAASARPRSTRPEE